MVDSCHMDVPTIKRNFNCMPSVYFSTHVLDEVVLKLILSICSPSRSVFNPISRTFLAVNLDRARSRDVGLREALKRVKHKTETC